MLISAILLLNLVVVSINISCLFDLKRQRTEIQRKQELLNVYLKEVKR